MYAAKLRACRRRRARRACAADIAQAQCTGWPQRPVKFVLPLGPGSGADIGARLLADKLSTKWGQPVVVENCPGGDGFVAITSFVSSNDYTLFWAGFVVHRASLSARQARRTR